MLGRLLTGNPQDIHNPTTSDLDARIDRLERKLKTLQEAMKVIETSWDEFYQKTRREAERARAYLSRRKNGKFGPGESPSEDDQAPALPLGPEELTHAQIKDLKRKEGFRV